MLSMVNLLPMPWPLRLLWLRFVYWMTAKGTLLFPSILGFVEGQNVVYRMGKQEGEKYESMVQLEKVLESVESSHVSIDRIKETLAQAEAEAVPADQLGPFIAQALFDPDTAESVLQRSLQTTRY